MVAKFAKKKESLGGFMDRIRNKREISWRVSFIMDGQSFEESMNDFLLKCFDYGSSRVTVVTYSKEIESGGHYEHQRTMDLITSE